VAGTARREPPSLPSRIAEKSDIGGLTRTISAAFCADPLWTWAFPEVAKQEPYWRLLINGALRYPWVWVAGDYAAVTVWIPPGESELSDQEEASVAALLEDLLGPRSADVMELVERFGAWHPAEPHYYLSLLGTHPDARGYGHGMALLAENLARIDEQRMPAYLESSNPANDERYKSLGFARVGEFSTPDDRHTVATMWRDPRWLRSPACASRRVAGRRSGRRGGACRASRLHAGPRAVWSPPAHSPRFLRRGRRLGSSLSE
jgi:GNAT superfamily N-acetyltransferase